MIDFFNYFVPILLANGVFTGFIVWISKAWISERLKNSIKNEYDQKLETHKAQLKAQVDTETERLKAQLKSQSDTETERLKSDLHIMASEHQVRFSGLHNRRAEVIAEVYEQLVQAYWDGASFASPAEFSGEPTKQEKYRTAMQSLGDFYRNFEKKRIYIPEEVCLLIDPLVEEMRMKIIMYGTYLDYEGPGMLDHTMREKHRVWMESWAYFNKEVPIARRALEQELRSLLGDSTASQANAPATDSSVQSDCNADGD